MRTTPVTCLLAIVLAVLFLPVQAAKENFDRSKPHLSFYARSTGPDLANFDVIRGLGVEIEAVEYQDKGDPVLRKRPGRVKYGDITLRRPYRGTSDVETWALAATRGEVKAHDITITIIDKRSRVVRTYLLYGAFPTRWTVDTAHDGNLTETLQVAVERVELQ